MKKPELISPAGTLEKLKTAFIFGADAVYAGVPDFSLRARINDFTYDKIKQGTEYAHKRGKKVYATLNIYPHNKHIKKIETAIKKHKKIRVDGLVISDVGVLKLAKQIAPKIPIHLSTQANCVNWKAVRFWQKQGVKRIVLARETSLKEIFEIHKKVPKIELECFVHGAMCMSYSGRCILSKLFSGRSANLGCCAQPCRREYKISLADEEEKNLLIDQDRHGTYILNSKDLCLIEYLGKLVKAGISSFKLEGRTKSAYYLAAITKLYRQTIDNNYIPPKGYKQELQKITNRGYTNGFLFSENKCEHNFEQSHKECKWQFVGEVIKNKENRLFIKVHNALYLGDEVEFVTPIGKNSKLKLDNLKDAKANEDLKEVHGGNNQIAVVNIDKKINIPIGSMLRKKI